MAQTKNQPIQIRGVVCAVPGDPVDVLALGRNLGIADVERIAKTVGLKTLHRASPGQTAGDLCVAAAEKLLSDLRWPRESVDAVLMVTQTPDHFLPATSCVAHGRLGLSAHCLAFDVGMGCSGYVYGLWMASQFAAGGTCRRVLLLAGDTVSHLLSPQDKSVALLFGDAGSATALEFDGEGPRAAFVLGTDGSGRENLCVPAGGFRQRATAEAAVRASDEAGNLRAPADLYMDGIAIFNFTLQRVPGMVNDVLAIQHWELSDVDAFVFHQANQFMLEALAKKMKLPRDRVPINIGKFGNTSMVSVPLLLCDTIASRIQDAAPFKALLAGFGVGYSWAAAALTLSGLQSARVVQV